MTENSVPLSASGHITDVYTPGTFRVVDNLTTTNSLPYSDLLERHQRLQAAEGALRALLDAALIGVWEYDLIAGRALPQPAVGATDGRRDFGAATLGSVLEHVASDQRDLFAARFDEFMSRGQGDFNCPITRPDGSPAWIWSTGRDVCDNRGTPVRRLGIVIDVTRQKVAEFALALERERKETFVSTLAHELRQPLSALLAGVEVIALSPDLEGVTRAIEIMKRQIGQMSRVIDDLTDAARWARGKVSLRLRRVDVREVVLSAARDVATAVSERGHHLEVNAGPAPLWADADSERLQQVLSNLLRNAIKYTDAGGEISLAAEADAALITLRVGDTGRGVHPEALTRIFDLFSQVRPGESAGLGIGLSVVREIVALHGGRIEAHSEGVGRGSEFVVTLPLAPAAREPKALAAPDAPV